MWLIILLTLLTTFFLYFKQKFTYFSSKNIPTLPPSIPFGNIGFPPTRTRAFYESVAETHKKFKSTSPYAGFYSLTIPHFIPIDIQLIKRILITDFSHFVDRGLFHNEEADPLSANLFFIGGNRWRTMRQHLTSTFTSAKMQSMFPILIECSQRLIAKLEGYQGDVRELFACYSMEVIGSCAFGLDLSQANQNENEFRKYTRKIFEYSPGKTLMRLASMVWPKLCQKLGVKFIPEDVSDFFINVVKDIVKLREMNGDQTQNAKRNDFLDLLLEIERTGLLSKQDFAAQSFVFFIAGFETSSTTLGYLMYELARNPEIQEECRREIFNTFARNDNCDSNNSNKVKLNLTYEKLMTMKFLDEIVEETLRLYPVLPFLNRECTKDFRVDDGLELKVGDRVIISTLALHMDAEYFPEPEKFDPGRFQQERRRFIEGCSYMPFGEGPRKCIGLRFGLMQVKVGLVSILSNFKVSITPETPEKLIWDTNGFTLKCKQEIRLNFERLKD